MKKILLILIPLLLVINASPILAFNDLSENRWSYYEITYLTGKEVINGYPDDTFRGHFPITRAQTAALLARQQQLVLRGNRVNPFNDVSSYNIYLDDILAVVNANIFTGKGPHTFAPNEHLTRAELAVVLYRAFDFIGTETTDFTDVPRGVWYEEAVNALYSNGIISGYSNGTYGPRNNVTREEFSVMLARAVNPEFRLFGEIEFEEIIILN